MEDLPKRRTTLRRGEVTRIVHPSSYGTGHIVYYPVQRAPRPKTGRRTVITPAKARQAQGRFWMSDRAMYHRRRRIETMAQGYRIQTSTQNWTNFHPGKKYVFATQMKIHRHGIIQPGKPFFNRTPIMNAELYVLKRGNTGIRVKKSTRMRRNIGGQGRTTKISKPLVGKGWRTVPTAQTETRYRYKRQYAKVAKAKGFRTSGPKRYLSAQQLHHIRQAAAKKRRRNKGKFA